MKDPKITMDTVRSAVTLQVEGRNPSTDILDLVRAAAELESFERQLRAIYARQCNGYSDHRGDWDDDAQARDVRREYRLLVKARELGARYGVALSEQGDPRGSALRIKTPISGRYNTLGGAESGWAL